jgi:hypothetical protein
MSMLSVIMLSVVALSRSNTHEYKAQLYILAIAKTRAKSRTKSRCFEVLLQLIATSSNFELEL